MYVVATAGHVDHGKSTLVRALTEMDPDRWEEEKRRGLTIDLGFAWTTLPSGADVAFVDVPGHEKFLGNMLAGVGPAPVVLFVVAADEGWQAQSTDHRDALRALGVEHGIIALTRSDRATVDRTAEIRTQLAGTPLADVPIIPVSAPTGDGIAELRQALDEVLAAAPVPDAQAPVRLWVDRAFSVKGAGTVVTGTLAAGTLRVGDSLKVATAGGERTWRSVACIVKIARRIHSAPSLARPSTCVGRMPPICTAATYCLPRARGAWWTTLMSAAPLARSSTGCPITSSSTPVPPG